MEEIVSNALAKMNEEMATPHFKELTLIHNLLCDTTDDLTLMEGILKDGKSIKGSFEFIYETTAKAVKSGARSAGLTQDEVLELLKKYFADEEANLDYDPSEKIPSSKTKIEVKEVVKEVIKEIKVSLDKKSKQSLEAILDLEVSNDEKIRLLQSLIKTESEEVKETEENMSIFDFGLEFEDE